VSDDTASVPGIAAAQVPAQVHPRALSWPKVLSMTFGHFTNDFYASFLAPLLPLIVTKFSLSLTLAGLLGTAFNTSGAFAQPLFGVAADRTTRPVYAILGPLLTVIGMGALGLAPSYQAALALLFLAGVGTASFHPQAYSLAGSISGARLGTGLSVFVFGGGLGYALGPLFIAALVGPLGLRGTLVAALPGAVGCFMIWRAIRGWTAVHARSSGGFRSDFAGYGRSFALIWVIVLVQNIITQAHILFLPLLLEHRGQSLIVGGVAVFLFGGIGALGGLVGGVLSDRIGRREVMALSFVVGAPLLVLFGITRSAWGLVPLALGGFALYLSAPVNVVMAQEMLPRRASLASSLVTGLSWGTAGLSLTLVGAIAERIGLSATLLATLSLSLVSLLAIWALPKHAPQVHISLTDP
jgi:FSR family fosmidomycin resistance protein-like MFS transporter